MRKTLRYLFQYAILAVFAFFVHQAAFKRDAPPVHDRGAWSQRDGFVAIAYGGVTVDQNSGLLVTKARLREHLEALARAGYQTVTTRDVVDFYENNKPLPEKALYLMFEGGRKDSVLFSQPVLTPVGYNAALYVYGDRLTGWNRFFVRAGEIGKVADNPFWDVEAMGYHSELINQTADGRYAHYLTDYRQGPDGGPAETQEAFDARVADDYRLAFQTIDTLAGTPPLGYLFMPANTLGLTLPEALARPNEAALAQYFPVAFTRVGESYNSRDAAPRALTRMAVSPDWTAERLLLEIESRLPKAGFQDFADSVRQGQWQILTGELAADGDRLTLASPPGKDGFARLRGSEGFENFLCQVTTEPSPDGASLIYLRYRDAGSFARIQTTADRVLVQEKNGSSLNTIFQYVLPFDHSGPVAYDICVKSNRLLLRVDGASVSAYPIPLSSETSRGSFALGSMGRGGGHPAVFADLRLTTFPPRWVAVERIADLPSGEARTLTTVLLPAASLAADPVRDAAALVTAAANGLTVFLDLSDADEARVVETARFVETAPGSMVFVRLLRGFVLSMDRFEDPARLALLLRGLREKGLAVALRLGPAAKARLLAADRGLDPDWLLFDVPPADDAGEMTTLKNRFDRTRMLFREPAPAGSPTVYYDVKG